MIKIKRIILLVTVVIFLPVFGFAAELSEEEVVPRNKKIFLDRDTERSFLERGKLKNLLSVSAGYDNNTHLDTRRLGDGFIQTFFKSTFTSPLNPPRKTLEGFFEYELMGLVYMDEANLNLVKNGLHAGLNSKLSKDLLFTTGYYVEYLDYANTGGDDFVENKLDFKLKQNLPAKIYHSVLYEFSYKNYLARLNRLSASNYSDKKRDDIRHTMDYEIGKYFTKDLFKINFQYYNNDSDETYLKYYDYSSWKVGGSFTHLFSDKLFTYFAFSRQYRGFRSRTITLDTNAEEWDRTYLITSAWYYNLNKSLTLNLSYIYRENWSNEPVENYSGSLITLATYYRF